jgi:outer membrane cobalamin receptor
MFSCSIRAVAAGLAAVAVSALAAVPAECGQASPDPQTPTFTLSITEPAEIIETVGTTRRIDQSEIRATNARTLDEALELLPGVYIRTGGDGTPRVDVRGFRSRHVLLLVDGVPVNSTADGQFDPRQISTESIREIKVSYGSSSMLYGDNAMAGVVEITTDAPAEGVHGVANVDVGQSNERDGSGRVSVGHGPVSFVLSGSAFGTDGFRVADAFTATSNQGGGLRANSDVQRRSALAKLGYAPSDSLKLGAMVTFANGLFGRPPITVSDATDVFAQQVRYERTNDYQNVAAQASLGYQPSTAFNLRTWAYVNSQDEDLARYDDATYSSMSNPLVSGNFQEQNKTRISGGQALGRLDLGRAGWLRFSVSGRRESFDSTGIIRDVAVGGTGGGTGGGGGGGGGKKPVTPAPVTYAVRSFDESSRVDVFSTGGEWEFRPSAGTGVVFGVSQDWQQRQLADGATGTGWLAGFSYDITKDVRLHASGTRKVRFPSIQQLYDPTAGDPALRPERAYELEVGVDRSWGDSRLSVAGFTTRATNFIERDSGSFYRNRDRYQFSGMEVAIETQPVKSLAVHAAYSLLDSQDLSGTGGVAGLQYRPRHRTTLDTRWAVRPRVSARAMFQYVADQVYYSRGTPAIQAHADNYLLADVSATGALSNRFDVTMSVANLFDRLYEQAYGYPREGRAVRLTLGARF